MKSTLKTSLLTAAISIGICAVAGWLAATQMPRFDFWIRNRTEAPGVAQSYAAAAQALAAVISLVVNAVLVAITFYYARLTRSISETAQSQLNASTFPMLAFKFGEQKVIFNEVAVAVTIHNSGGSAVKVTECVFGGFVETSAGPVVGDRRLKSVKLRELEGVFIGQGQSAIAYAQVEMVDGSPLEVLNATRRFSLRVDCTDPAGKARHSFTHRSDGNILYRDFWGDCVDVV